MVLNGLSSAEAEVMLILWRLENASVKDFIREFPEPKPAYNTISKLLKALEIKKFVAHRLLGKSYQYFPIIGKEEYRFYATEQLFENYNKNSAETTLSIFVEENKLDLSQADEVLKKLKKITNTPK